MALVVSGSPAAVTIAAVGNVTGAMYRLALCSSRSSATVGKRYPLASHHCLASSKLSRANSSFFASYSGSSDTSAPLGSVQKPLRMVHDPTGDAKTSGMRQCYHLSLMRGHCCRATLKRPKR